MTRRFVLLFSLLGLAACETEPGLDFAFQSLPLNNPPAVFPRDSVGDFGSGILRITRNNVVLPCFNDVLTGDGDRNGQELTLTVTRRPQTPCSDERDRVNRYEALYGNLRAGSYRVRVFENLGGTEQLVKDTTVSVN